MELSLLLAQIAGVYLTVVGVSVVAKQRMLREAVDDFFKNHFLVYFAGEMLLILGLLVVLNHNIWVQSWEVIITLIGWVMLLKGAMFLLLGEKNVKSMVKMFNSSSSYTVWGIIAILLGIYLIFQGFGL